MGGDRDLLISTVNQLLAEEFELPLEKITPQSQLFEEFGLDSLDGIDMLVAIEKRFKVRVNEKRGADIRTVADVYAFVEATLRENGIDNISALWAEPSDRS